MDRPCRIRIPSVTINDSVLYRPRSIVFDRLDLGEVWAIAVIAWNAMMTGTWDIIVIGAAVERHLHGFAPDDVCVLTAYALESLVERRLLMETTPGQFVPSNALVLLAEQPAVRWELVAHRGQQKVSSSVRGHLRLLN